MEYISSDTNVWIDFFVIDRLQLPFKLPYTYIMNSDAVEDELLAPTGIRNELLKYGLLKVELTVNEFDIAGNYGICYPRLSIYDRIALAIAKERKIVLLTGDAALRKAAINEDVDVLGTIGILDQLISGGYINEIEYKKCLLLLKKYNGRKIRLPEDEISTRLQKLKNI